MFNLSYHQNYLEVCSLRISLVGIDVLKVGGPMAASLVIDQHGCNSWTGVEAPSYDKELGEATSFTAMPAITTNKNFTRAATGTFT